MSSIATNRLVLCLLTAVFLGWAGSVGAATGWYCEPLHAFYPAVRSCPASWQLAAESQAAQPKNNQANIGQTAQPKQQAPEAEALPPSPKPPADPGGQATFPAPPSLAHGDQLDEWCKGMTTAINFAVCSDDGLRKLALERLRAFNEANARLAPDQRKVLAADQNGWALSYPQACGLAVAERPTLPLASSIKECLADAGRKRLSYLRSYGLAEGNATPPATAPATTDPASPVPAQTEAAPSDSGASAKSAATAAPDPPAQQNQSAAAPTPSGSEAAHQDAKPAATDKPVQATREKKPAANEKPGASGGIPDTAKIGALLIATLVVGLWLGSGLRRWRGPNRHDRSSPTA